MVTERQSGLRFDIYERIHLAEETAAVRELNEVELVPHIQVYTEQEQALLKGHLYLTGSYLGETSGEQRTLEHLIPVEITLPLNRIQDVSQVSVDIDNFDVDVLNSRSLNVTGVLTLHGIEMLSAPEEAWQEEEETVFVHEAPVYGDVSASRPVETWQQAAYPGISQQPQFTQQEPRQEEPSPWTPYQTRADTWRSEPVQQQPTVQEPVNEAPQAAENENAEWVPLSEAAEEPPEALSPVTTEPPSAQLPAAEPPGEEAPEPQPEEKKELKIAFGSKASNNASYHLQSLIHTNEYRAQPSDPEEEPPTPRTDALEWKRLFSHTEGEERQFSKVRVCIVQKEETLDSIAERYSLNPKEIQLYNRLADGQVAEGRALFIPR